MNSCRRHRNVTWASQIIAAIILLQTLFYKFTGSAESFYIFTQLGAEPWGRIGAGIVELIAAILLLSGRFSLWGGLLASGLMIGALGSHLTRLGIVVKDDGGLLFTLAWIVLVSAAMVVWLRRSQLPFIGERFAQMSCGTSADTT